jgi:hypothetical protein
MYQEWAKITEIIYLEKGYTSAGIHGMGHFGMMSSASTYNNKI